MAETSLVLQLLGVLWRLLGQLVAVESLVFVIMRPKLLQGLHARLAKHAVYLTSWLHGLGLIRGKLRPGEFGPCNAPPFQGNCQPLGQSDGPGFLSMPARQPTHRSAAPNTTPRLSPAEEARVVCLLEEPSTLDHVAWESESDWHSEAMSCASDDGCLASKPTLVLPRGCDDTAAAALHPPAAAAGVESAAEVGAGADVDGGADAGADTGAEGDTDVGEDEGDGAGVVEDAGAGAGTDADSSSSLPTVDSHHGEEPSPAASQPSCQRPAGSRPARPPRPADVDQDELLRLLAEAYGQMMLARGGEQGDAQSEANPEGWLRQLRELALSGDGDTVLALFGALRAQHSWARLRDVYSALVRLREGAAAKRSDKK